MEDAGHSSKKRFAAGQLSRDNSGYEEDGPEPEMGTFQRASDEVLATRKIVKVRRHQPPSTNSSSSNPFAKISFSAPPPFSVQKVPDSAAQSLPRSEIVTGVPSSDNGVESAKEDKEFDQNGKSNDAVNLPAAVTSEKEDKEDGGGDHEVEEKVKEETEEKQKEEKVKEGIEEKEKEEEAKEGTEDKEKEEDKVKEAEVSESERQPGLSSFRQLSSSQNAFSGLSGTGFSASSFSFGSVSSGSLFGLSSIGSTTTTNLFSVATSTGGATQGTLSEVTVETGEENEQPVFTADAVLFEFIDGGWKERGKGEVKVNVSNAAKKSRLIMRARGNLRLILNANLYPDMALTAMEKRGVTFACVNSAVSEEGKAFGLATFALKFKDPAMVEEFRTVVEEHKGERVATASLQTPENSPKGSAEE